MNYFTEEPNWFIQIIIGTFLAILFPYIWRVFKLIYYHFKKDYLINTWYGYHYSFKKNEPVFIKSLWKIKRAIKSNYKVKISIENNILNYYGKLRIERNNIMISMRCKQHKETLQLRLEYNIQSNSEILVGIGLSFDHDLKIISSAMFLSKNILSENEVIFIFHNRFKTINKYNVVRIP